MNNHLIECDKCHEFWDSNCWEYKRTYKGIDQHHNPPKFMVEKWEGKIYNLCRKHHRELHDEIIKILQKYSNQLKKVKSEYWTWIYILPKDRKECVKEITEFTKKWVEDDS